MTGREGYENPTYLSGLRFKDTPSCSMVYFMQFILFALVNFVMAELRRFNLPEAFLYVTILL